MKKRVKADVQMVRKYLNAGAYYLLNVIIL